MLGATEPEIRLILRAKVRRTGSSSDVTPIVGHTMTLSADELVLRSDEVGEVGEKLEVELSFPGLVQAFTLAGQLAFVRMAAGAAEHGAWQIAIEGNDLEPLRSVLGKRGQPGRAYRVLVVDDNRMTTDVFLAAATKTLGADSNIQIDVAHTVEEAWGLLETKSFDLTIIDYYLANERGDTLIEKIRGSEGHRDRAVVAVSVGGREAHDATLHAGADMFLDKPLVVRDLFSTLKHLTGSEAS